MTPTLAPGYRFRPLDEELVDYYLRKRVHNNGPLSLFDGIVSECDLYGTDPWKIWDSYGGDDKLHRGEEGLYFFTRLKKLTEESSRKERTVGTGSWHGDTSGIPVVNNKTKKKMKIGLKKRFRYENPNSKQDRCWLMIEFSLLGVNTDIVLCLLKKKDHRKRTLDESADIGCDIDNTTVARKRLKKKRISPVVDSDDHSIAVPIFYGKSSAELQTTDGGMTELVGDDLATEIMACLECEKSIVEDSEGINLTAHDNHAGDVFANLATDGEVEFEKNMIGGVSGDDTNTDCVVEFEENTQTDREMILPLANLATDGEVTELTGRDVAAEIYTKGEDSSNLVDLTGDDIHDDCVVESNKSLVTETQSLNVYGYSTEFLDCIKQESQTALAMMREMEESGINSFEDFLTLPDAELRGCFDYRSTLPEIVSVGC